MMQRLALVLGAAGITSIAGAQVEVYSSDFETNDGGWTNSGTGGFAGDWEHTTNYDPFNFIGAATPPASANSGTGMWGTLINDNHTNSGEFNLLSQTFDFSAVSGAELSFASWSNVFGNFDYSEVIVNGTVVASTVSSPPAGVQQLSNDTGTAGSSWVVETIDLSDYDGNASVEIQFSMFATTVVNRAGWYIDDVRITGAGSVCVPDLNGDGVVDADDFFLFLQLFAAGDTRADINNDGVIDADDFFVFLNLFAQGC